MNKFRAWDERKKEYHKEPIAVSNDGVLRMDKTGEKDVWLDTSFIAEEYTNISQGELEFYEGDILRFSVFDHNGSDYTKVGKIVCGYGSWVVECENGDVLSLGFITINYDCVEIIGNIRENKELLEGNNEM